MKLESALITPATLGDHPKAMDVWKRLTEGNSRFLAGETAWDGAATVKRRMSLAQAQNPFAAVLTCSDSRLPVEIVFDQGLGDLFVVRVAGNTIAPSLIGSLEFASMAFDLPLIVVLGHEGCGAVKAACRMILNRETPPSPHLEIMLEEIQPSVLKELERRPLTEDLAKLVNQTGDIDPGLWSGVCQENVEHAIQGLLNRSDILRTRVESGHLGIVGGVYDIGTGLVRWLN